MRIQYLDGGLEFKLDSQNVRVAFLAQRGQAVNKLLEYALDVGARAQLLESTIKKERDVRFRGQMRGQRGWRGQFTARLFSQARKQRRGCSSD